MEYDIIETKDWIIERGMLNSRVVLLKIKNGGAKYSTHLQCKNEDGSKYLVMGHYYTKLEEALADFRAGEV